MMELEKAIGITLRIGVALSVILIFIGIFLTFVNENWGGLSEVNSSTFSFAQILYGLFQLDGASFIFMGLIVLIATPITRVLLSIFGFFFEKNWLYFVITIIVFTNLMIAIFVIPGLIAH